MAITLEESATRALEPKPPGFDAILFDFGGVLAQEGFREGLMAIARSNHLPEWEFFRKATKAVYETGYVLGKADETTFWDALRNSTGIRSTDRELRQEILRRFTLRPWMLEIVGNLKKRGLIVALLTDQTQWLDELDSRYSFIRHFHKVFNSFHMGKGKNDPTIFREVVGELRVTPERTLFIDDNPGNVERARAQGLQTILFEDKDSFVAEMQRFGLL